MEHLEEDHGKKNKIMQYDFTIRANNGNESIEFQTLKLCQIAGETFLIFKILLHSKFWDRASLRDGDCVDLVDDKTVTLHQVIVAIENWYTFLRDLENWKSTNELFNNSLSEFDGQKVNCELYVSDELISSKEKPIFQLSIVEKKHTVTWKVVIDKTCV